MKEHMKHRPTVKALRQRMIDTLRAERQAASALIRQLDKAIAELEGRNGTAPPPTFPPGVGKKLYHVIQEFLSERGAPQTIHAVIRYTLQTAPAVVKKYPEAQIRKSIDYSVRAGRFILENDHLSLPEWKKPGT